MFSIILLLFSISLSTADDPCPKFTPPTGPFNLELYLGVWYEMARIETPFELGIDCANATYTPKGKGRIGITNAGKYLKSGMVASVSGEGRQTEQVNVLKVRLIAGEPEANYWIVETDFTSYALVCSCTTLPIGTFKGAWLLSRNKTMEKSRYDYLAAKLPALGIDPSDLQKTEQLAC